MVFEADYELLRFVETDEFLKIWRDMLGKLTHDSEWCKMLNTNDVVVLWQHYLSTNLIPPVMKRLIRRVLADPIGSADVEWAFSKGE